MKFLIFTCIVVYCEVIVKLLTNAYNFIVFQRIAKKIYYLLSMKLIYN